MVDVFPTKEFVQLTDERGRLTVDDLLTANLGCNFVGSHVVDQGFACGRVRRTRDVNKTKQVSRCVHCCSFTGAGIPNEYNVQVGKDGKMTLRYKALFA